MLCKADCGYAIGSGRGCLRPRLNSFKPIPNACAAAPYLTDELNTAEAERSLYQFGSAGQGWRA